MPFRLANALEIFQQLMSIVLVGLKKFLVAGVRVFSLVNLTIPTGVLKHRQHTIPDQSGLIINLKPFRLLLGNLNSKIKKDRNNGRGGSS